MRLDTLSLDGVMLLTSAAGVYLGDERWDPVLEELDRRAAYVFVTPASRPTRCRSSTIPCGCTSSRSRPCARSQT